MMLIFPQRRTNHFDDLFSGPPPHGGYGGPPPHGPPPPGVPGRELTSIQPWDPSQSPPPPGFHGTGPLPIDDPNSHDPTYPPPSIHDVRQFQGYEKVGGFGRTQPVPPLVLPQPPSGDPPGMEFDQIANLNKEQCREAMLNYVSEHCCFGKKAARQMEINKILPLSALHYTLETFCENRSTGYVFRPYQGGFVDGPEYGIPPLPWQIPCTFDQMFHDHTKKIEVPHTAVLKRCHGCHGHGWLRCHRCQGRGQVRCGFCHGRGNTQRYDRDRGHYNAPCNTCGGDGHKRCGRCSGDGRITCSVCQGFKRLKCYIELTVAFVNNYDDHILEKTDMPDELVRHVGGTVIMEQTLPFVWPITSYPIAEICNASARLVSDHRQRFAAQKQISQRQQLRAVPVTEVLYQWKDASFRFWVYGNERKVHAPEYPQQCCWGCTIL
ncbi:protein SSUH2 homolog [Liolophura sinensis]|uniref:protein SSUH2 homolog n=1 Tax=Liolophura sinensis TaxID=3198878 RepID=UPI0031596088